MLEHAASYCHGLGDIYRSLGHLKKKIGVIFVDISIILSQFLGLVMNDGHISTTFALISINILCNIVK
jgi:hypothetical protein